jgi:hypothetical protein
MTRAVTPSCPTDATLAYCRHARRLRGRLGRDPSRLHVALRALAEAAPVRGRTDRERKPTAVVARRATLGCRRAEDHPVAAALLVGLSPAVESAVRRFVGMVHDTVAVSTGRTNVLTFDHRQALLHQAQAMGIGRFHANLVIAAVLHGSARCGAGSGGVATCGRGTSRAALVAVALTQIAVVAGAVAVGWWVGW